MLDADELMIGITKSSTNMKHSSGKAIRLIKG